jgi:PAS domain-containing protein
VKNYEFNDVFDCVDIPVFIHGEDFRLIYANQAYLSIADTDESEALGKLYWEVFPKQ